MSSINQFPNVEDLIESTSDKATHENINIEDEDRDFGTNKSNWDDID